VRKKSTWEWLDVGKSAMALSLDSAAVIRLRLAGAASTEPTAAAEAWRMYSEKIQALVELQTLFLTGSLGASPARAAKRTVQQYQRKVAANRRRLGKS
jgi:hypothetical protein